MSKMKEFWNQLSNDFLDVLQNNILNFSTFIGLALIYIKIFHNQYYLEATDFVTVYLLSKKD